MTLELKSYTPASPREAKYGAMSPAHVVLGVRGLLVLGERIEQRVRVGDVVAHRSEERIRVVGQAFGRRRLLLEFADHVGVVRVNVDHAELVGLLKRLADACHGELRTRFDVLLDHLAEVHAVDVVRRRR